MKMKTFLAGAMILALLLTACGERKIDRDEDLEVKWGTFTKGTDHRDRDFWEMAIEVKNNQEEMVILNLNGEGKERNWYVGNEGMVESGRSGKIDFKIMHYFFDEEAFDKKKITLDIYECSKLPESIEEKLCISEYGFDGILPPWQVIREKEEAGTPISPTSVHTKYFDFNSLEVPPAEISEEEYMSG